MSLLIKSLSLQAGTQKILSNINLNLSSPSFLAILGPSGSGKTTLIRAILGLVTNYFISGSIYYQNKLIQENNTIFSPLRTRGFAYIPQQVMLWPHLTVYKTLRLCAQWSKNNNTNFINNIINLSGLGNHMYKKPAQLSGGEKQRLALARVLVARPQLIIFDEPFSALDLVAKTKLIKLIQEAHNYYKFDSILITHDLYEAQALATSIMLLIAGQNIWHGPTQELNKAPFPGEWPLWELAKSQS
jgi:iron(III) transport system ATP-binding protein